MSIDDSEVMAFSQRGVAAAPDASGIIEMDGRGWKAEELHAITESEIRAFYEPTIAR